MIATTMGATRIEMRIETMIRAGFDVNIGAAWLFRSLPLPPILCPDHCPDHRRFLSSSLSLSRSSSIYLIMASTTSRFINRESPAKPGSALFLSRADLPPFFCLPFFCPIIFLVSAICRSIRSRLRRFQTGRRFQFPRKRYRRPCGTCRHIA